MFSSIIGGIAAGWFSSFVTAPLDVLRTRQAVHGHTRCGTTIPDGIYRPLRKIFVDEGIRGIYRGLGAVQFALVPTWSIYFTTYSYIKEVYGPEFERRGNSTPLHIMAAMAAGISTDVATAPFWMTKTRLQLQWISGESHYRGTFHALQKIAQEEGVRALWQGLTPQLVGVLHVMIQFPLYESWKKMLTPEGEGKDRVPIKGVLLASAASKTVATVLAYPHEVVRTRFQYQKKSDPHRYLSLRQAVKRMWRKEGPASFYLGLRANLCRTIPSCMVTFIVYEEVKSKLDHLFPSVQTARR